MNEIYSDGWLHRGQELAVHKEAYLLSQTGVASLQRGRDGESKRNSISPDPHTNSENSDSLSVSPQPCANSTSPGVMSEEKLKKFKYEPLEDETDCWRGMLFEQDLYGRVCRGNYGKSKVKSQSFSTNDEEIATHNMITSINPEPKKVLDSDMKVADLLNLSSTLNPDTKALDDTNTPPESPYINNNVSFSLTLGDLNMNVNNSDFSFIDSDGSSQSEVADTLKGIKSIDGTDDCPIGAYHAETLTTPPDMFPLKDTYIPEMNSSFEITTPLNKLCKVSSVCKHNCQDCQCTSNNMAPHGLSHNQEPNQSDLESQDFKRTVDDFKNIPKVIDDNGNPDSKMGALNQKEAFSGVVSARLRPKGVSRQNSTGSPNVNRKSVDREFEQLLSLVQNISGVSEGPLSYQPTKAALSTLLAINQQGDVTSGDQSCNDEPDPASQMPLNNNNNEVAGKPCDLSFEDLHAKVAPSSRTPSKSKIAQSLHDPDPPAPCIPCERSLSADSQAALHPTPPRCPSLHPSSMGPGVGASTTLARAPYTSSATSTTDQPLVDARHSLLPEETQPANNLPHQESR